MQCQTCACSSSGVGALSGRWINRNISTSFVPQKLPATTPHPPATLHQYIPQETCKSTHIREGCPNYSSALSHTLSHNAAQCPPTTPHQPTTLHQYITSTSLESTDKRGLPKLLSIVSHFVPQATAPPMKRIQSEKSLSHRVPATTLYHQLPNTLHSNTQYQSTGEIESLWREYTKGL